MNNKVNDALNDPLKDSIPEDLLRQVNEEVKDLTNDLQIAMQSRDSQAEMKVTAREQRDRVTERNAELEKEIKELKSITLKEESIMWVGWKLLDGMTSRQITEQDFADLLREID